MNRKWINNFSEKLSGVEGHFERYVSIFLKFENQFVLGLKDSKDWFYENNKRKGPLSVFGGKLEEQTEPASFLKSICFEQLGVHITIKDSPHTYIDYHHRLKKIPAHSVQGPIRPQIISIVQNTKYSTVSNALIFSYLGYTGDKPKPSLMKYSALMLGGESVLVQIFKNEKNALELKKAGAVFEERIKIPDHLYLYPTGSLNSLLRYLSYEVF